METLLMGLLETCRRQNTTNSMRRNITTDTTYRKTTARSTSHKIPATIMRRDVTNRRKMLSIKVEGTTTIKALISSTMNQGVVDDRHMNFFL